MLISFLCRIRYLLIVGFCFGFVALNAQSPPVHSYSVTPNIVWAAPDSIDLLMDIYMPDTAKDSYPVVVIFHGGGWLINDKSNMDSLSVYLVSHADCVVCNVNYRLLSDMGNTVPFNETIDDALGAVLWIKEHIAAYKGDPNRIIVSGDSAGGHLASMVMLCGNKLNADGFAGASLGFRPTYMPKNLSIDDLIHAGGVTVQGAMLNYPAVDLYSLCKSGFEHNVNIFWSKADATPRKIFCDSISINKNPECYKAVSPIYNIPLKAERVLPPQLCMVGSRDIVTRPAKVEEYVQKCIDAGQHIQFFIYKGQPHAFLESQPSRFWGTDFSEDAPWALEKMISFINMYNDNKLSHVTANESQVVKQD